MHGYGQFRTRRSRSVDLSVLSSFTHHQSPQPHFSTPAAPKAKEVTATRFAAFNEEEEEEAEGGGGEGEEQNLGVVLCRKSCSSSEKVKVKGELEPIALLRPCAVTRAFSMRSLSSASLSTRAGKWGSYSRIHDQIEADPSSSPADAFSKPKKKGKLLMLCKRLLGLK